MQDREKAMRRVGMKISLMMGLVMSFFQPLFGLLFAGKFTVPAWLISFALSVPVSWCTGLLVPIGKLSRKAGKRFHCAPGSLKERVIGALISDVVFTPLICLVNVLLSWHNAVSHGAQIPFFSMYIRSLGISLLTGFVLAFIFQPICMKLAMGRGPGGPVGEPGKKQGEN